MVCLSDNSRFILNNLIGFNRRATEQTRQNTSYSANCITCLNLFKRPTERTTEEVLILTLLFVRYPWDLSVL